MTVSIRNKNPSSTPDYVDALAALSADRSRVSTFSWPATVALLGVALLALLAGLITRPALRDNALSAAADAIGNTGEIMVGVLAIAITVVAIVVELAATRYTHRVTALFLRDRVNLTLLGLYTVTSLLCLWTSFVSPTRTPAGDPLLWLTLALISLSLASLLPYFAYVLGFISPLNIIDRLLQRGALAIEAATGAPISLRLKAFRAVAATTAEDLHDVARKALDQSDRSVAMASVTALFELLSHYADRRSALPRAWFHIDSDFDTDPDFVSLEDDALVPIRDHGLWFELKVYRQAIAVLSAAVPGLRDLASLIAIETRRYGIERTSSSAERELCVRAYNSYLRVCINAADARSTYYLLNQFRRLGQTLLRWPEERHSIHIAEHLRYYGQLAHERNQPFLLEVTAYDLVNLLLAAKDAAPGSDLSTADAMLDVLLELDLQIRDERDEPSLLGVRRAQLQLAARLLTAGDEARVQRIVTDLADESQQRLVGICRALENEQRSSFWELTERGVNFGYLEPEHRAHLQALLARIDAARSDA